ncbi:MAG: hypothetical protein KGK07_00630 [Chloroflexota bacterium]|nr:hypothetical protein [Chloroflexota bacterium]
MIAERVDAPPVAPHHWAAGRLVRDVFVPLSRFPDRLRDRRFWNIQLMVLAATIPHYAIEIAGFTNPFETFHGLAITLYVIPLLYAALSFGWEGAILTALWLVFLTSPSMWIWHRGSFHWLTEVGQLAITLPAGIMVAWRVDLESKQRQRAERMSARLSTLKDVGERLSRTMDVERVLPTVLERLLAVLPAQVVWLRLAPSAWNREWVAVIKSRERQPADGIPDEELQRLAEERREPVRFADRTAVPLAREGPVVGVLGVVWAAAAPVAEEQVEFLGAVAHEIHVAVENARLYRERQESLQTYARQVTQAQEDERLRLARELHDETAQELVHLVRRLERLREGAPADGRASEQLEDLLQLSRGILKSVRRFSRDLRPSVLDDLGLVPAIELAVEEANARLSDCASLEVSGTPRRLGSAAEVALFRIAQEALHNVEKHAQATRATVKLVFLPDCVRLAVEDDGRGFDVPENVSSLARLGKLGVLGMKERAELVGGSFSLVSAAHNGCTVSVTVETPGAPETAPAAAARSSQARSLPTPAAGRSP